MKTEDSFVGISLLAKREQKSLMLFLKYVNNNNNMCT